MNEDLVVSLPAGKLFGVKDVSEISKQVYYKFCGIPYAKPPIGHLRFLPPEPADKWPGLLDARNEKGACSQFDVLTNYYTGSEDCLYLNVYTPEIPCKITTPKAVLVLIHPGGHFWGSASKTRFGNPDFFIDQDIIFVTFNYRLHVLGFLNLNLPNCTGNMGLKDQAMAMSWVRKNIKYFGGDTHNITLYGSSSGACDVHLHTLSPLSRHLFDKVIMQCGYALHSLFSYNMENTKRAFQLGELLGCTKKQPKLLLSFLKSQSPQALCEAAVKLRKILSEENPEKHEVCLFLPTVEAFEEGAFICRSPKELIYEVTESKPLIVSMVPNEGIVAFLANPIKLVRKNLSNVIKQNLWMYEMNEEMLEYVTTEVRQFYFENKEINSSLTQDVINLYTNLWYIEWNNWLDFISSRCPTYVYYFTFDGMFCYQKRDFERFLKMQIDGPSHGDDSGYFMYYKMRREAERNFKPLPKDELQVAKNMSSMFISFVKTSNPNCHISDAIYWEPFSPENPSYLNLNVDMEIRNGRIYEANLHFWSEILKYIKTKEKENVQNININTNKMLDSAVEQAGNVTESNQDDESE